MSKRVIKQHQDFDKILKETFRSISFSLIEKVCQLKPPKLVELPMQLTRTKERRPDFAMRVETGEIKNDYVIHLEFQSQNDKRMHHRELEMYEMLFNETDLEVLQYVVYLGEKEPNMVTEVKHKNLIFSYDLISLKDIDVETFLQSDKPEELILAVLAKYPKANSSAVLDQILSKLTAIVENHRNLQKYYVQLEILSKLRKLQPLTKEKIDKMPVTYDLKTDVRFVQGQEQGIELERKRNEQEKLKRDTALIENLLLNSTLTTSRIAKFVDVPESIVQTIEERLIKAGKIKKEK